MKLIAAIANPIVASRNLFEKYQQDIDKISKKNKFSKHDSQNLCRNSVSEGLSTQQDERVYLSNKAAELDDQMYQETMDKKEAYQQCVSAWIFEKVNKIRFLTEKTAILRGS
ncbi:hypothetical protein CHS0354_025629 [Potamilus streckersoni]|uniref:Uncharacterized protein n=1 Tax=Potamilus streckersoni TaxID=2493646 RepID=A0AAE0S1B9_9BIVA|nr:hypothetical protein CHS0354_025629 [Potamilus streckersoni]